MSHSASASAIRSPVLLLLGLLLWGQCAFNLNDHGRYIPTVKVRVVRDSLALATKDRPAYLYLTLAFTNYLAQTCRLDTASGNVSFKTQYWNFGAASAHGLKLPAADNLQRPVLRPVAVALVPSVDSLAALRAALGTGSRQDNSLRVYLRATYASASEPDRQWPAEGSHLPPSAFSTLRSALAGNAIFAQRSPQMPIG